MAFMNVQGVLHHCVSLKAHLITIHAQNTKKKKKPVIQTVMTTRWSHHKTHLWLTQRIELMLNSHLRREW
jgi:hypothetical protein